MCLYVCICILCRCTKCTMEEWQKVITWMDYTFSVITKAWRHLDAYVLHLLKTGKTGSEIIWFYDRFYGYSFEHVHFSAKPSKTVNISLFRLDCHWSLLIVFGISFTGVLCYFKGVMNVEISYMPYCIKK